jgi:hypothetical protein
VRFNLTIFLLFATCLVGPSKAFAVYQCDGQVSDCSCGMTDPYPCCGTNGNCTWWAWRAACCHWKYAMPSPWQHAKYWAGNYATHPDFKVVNNATKNCVACDVNGEYGHVAFVEDVNGGQMKISEMACWGFYGLKVSWKSIPSGFDKFICLKSQMGPYCGDGKCNGGENCKSCQKDCGKCCGNGKCDFGETCSSCTKDCGPCNKPPVGELTRGDCAAIGGWAEDPDVGSPIQVTIRIDGQNLATVLADQDFPGHGKHGFEVPFPDSHKAGQIHTVSVIGHDDKGTADKEISGSGSKVMCRNDRQLRGLWDVVWTDAAGLDFVPVPADGSLAVKIHHAGGLDYPVSGEVRAMAQLGLSSADELALNAWGGFGGGPYSLGMTDGAELQVELTNLAPDGTGYGWPMTGATVTFVVSATDLLKDPVERFLRLSSIRTRSGNWWNSYSWDAAGIIWNHPVADSAQFQTRYGIESQGGWVRAELQAKKPFDGISFKVENELPSGFEGRILVDEEAVMTIQHTQQPGTVALAEQPGEHLVMEMSAPPGDSLAVGNGFIGYHEVRVFRNREEWLPPWRTNHMQAWGLQAVYGEEPSGSNSLVLSSTPDDGWYATGRIEASLEFELPAFDRIRGWLDVELPGQPFFGALSVDGEPLRTLSVTDSGGAFELSAEGQRVSLTLGTHWGLEAHHDARVGLHRLAVHRGDWWTVPSRDCAGLRDGREDPCTIRFDNLRWWGMAGHEAQGHIAVVRTLSEPVRGLRLKLDSTVPGGVERFFVLGDGKPLEHVDLLVPGSSEVEWKGDPVTEVGVAFAVAKPGVYPYRWTVYARQIEALQENGDWVSVCQLPEVQAEEFVEFGEGQLSDLVQDGSAVEVVEKSPGRSRAAGCSAGFSGTGFCGGALITFLLFVFCCVFWYREMNLVETEEES